MVGKFRKKRSFSFFNQKNSLIFFTSSTLFYPFCSGLLFSISCEKRQFYSQILCDSLYNTNSFVLTRDPDIPVLLKAPFCSATSSLLIPSLYYLPSTCFSLFASTTKTTQAAKKSVCWLRQDTTASKRAPSPKNLLQQNILFFPYSDRTWICWLLDKAQSFLQVSEGHNI